jgi:hypothetical protein
MNVDTWLEGLRSNQILTEREVKQLCIKVTEILCEVIYNYKLIIRNQMFSQLQLQ